MVIDNEVTKCFVNWRRLPVNLCVNQSNLQAICNNNCDAILFGGEAFTDVAMACKKSL